MFTQTRVKGFGRIRSVLIVAGLLTAMCGVVIATNTPAAFASVTSSNLGYPYYNEPCEHSPYTTSGGANYCSDYDWGPTPDTTPGWTESDSYDPNYGNYGYRNCTDYVAWQLAQYGVPAGDYEGLGDGGDWYTNAVDKGLPTGTTPEVGAAAVSSSNDHVAYVDAVNSNGTITVWEYNYDEAGDGDIQTATPAAMGFTKYVYFWGLMTSPPSTGSGGSGGGSTTGALLGVVAHSDGEQDVFWKGGDGNLWEAYWDGTSWVGPVDIGMGPLGSAPTVAILPSINFEYVFWKGGDGNLWEAYWDGSAWNGPVDLGMGPLGSQPIAVAWGNEIDVYWQGGDGNLWETFWDSGGGWYGPIDIGDGPLGSAPAVVAHSDGEQDVYWKGTDGNLWEIYWNGSAWVGPINLGYGTLGSPPTIDIMPATGEEDAFWEGGDGNLWQVYWNGSAWSSLIDHGYGTLGSPPSATSWGNEIDVFWRGGDGNLWEAYWNGSAWYGPVDIGMGPIPSG